MKRHLKKWRASVYYNQNGTFRSMQATCAPIESWLCFRISGIKAESGGTQKKRIRALVCDEEGAPLSQTTLRSRFDRAREKAGISKQMFQFRDLRAKAATEKEQS